MTLARPAPDPVYRADIDGLRAVAVLAVVVYHAFPTWGSGGFVGVDIFFVISGYLISKIIYAGVDAGQFSFVDFYDRRIRRIFPALLLVLGTCLLFAATATFPVEARAFGQQVLAGAAFVANLLFWHEAGYFDWASELKPLLHLWSLSVEEQYYIAWPLVVGLLWKRRGLLLPVVLALIVASFATNIGSLATGHAEAAFYSPLSRAWELLVGAWLAMGRRAWPWGTVGAGRFATVIPQAVSFGGAALIAAGFAFVRPRLAFPGFWALLPTVGAVCLIGAGPRAWFNRQVLASRLLVFFGKISYPLYLWHWPLLVFPKVYLGYSNRNLRVAAVVAAIGLAWLTYRFIEQPIRTGRRRASTPIWLASVSVVFAACGALLIVSDGWLGRLPAEMRDISTAQVDFDYALYRHRTCFLAAEQGPEAFAAECDAVDSPARERVALWGDSHAASLYPGLRALITGRPGIALSQFTAAACPPVLGMSIAQRPHCRAINDEVWRRLSAHPPSAVILAGNWTFYNGENGWEQFDGAALSATARRLREAGVARVIVLGPFARWLTAEPAVLLRAWRDKGVVPLRSLDFFDMTTFDVDKVVSAAAAEAGVQFMSPIAKLCDSSGCLQTVSSNGRRHPIAWDDAHLTLAASEVFAAEWLGDLLAPADSALPIIVER